MSKRLNSPTEEDIIRGKPVTRTDNKKLADVLNKFNKNVISSLIESSIDKQQTIVMKKKTLIKEAINLLTEKFSDLDELILYLQLKYIHCQKNKRLWRVLELQDARKLRKPGLTSKNVSYSIFKYCKKKNVSCKVFSQREGHCMWSVLYLDDGDSKTPAYVLTNMKFSLVFISCLKPKYKVTFDKVIQKVYKASDIEELPDIKAEPKDLERLNIKIYQTLQQSLSKLGGNEIQPLEKEKAKNKVVENKKAKEIRTKTVPEEKGEESRTNTVENKKAKEIRTKTVPEEKGEESRTNTVAKRKVKETKAERENCKKPKTGVIGKIKETVNKSVTIEKVPLIDRTAGFSNEASYDKGKKRTGDPRTSEKRKLPAIANLNYCVKSNSFGTEQNVNSVCVVEFQGTNVLKGLEKFVENGMADNQLPKYLYKEPKSGKTNYMITL